MHSKSRYFRELFYVYDILASRFLSGIKYSDISIFHHIEPPPTGGSSQFLRALRSDFEKRGFRVEFNSMSSATRACLFNASSFDLQRLNALYQGCKMVQRVDGPVSIYRGYNDGTDRRIWALNREFAEATIFQSRYSFQKHLELGYEFVNPCIVPNSVDCDIFYRSRRKFDRDKKIRIIATSWSNNPNKGLEVYQWIDRFLDWKRFDFTFVGRIDAVFRNIRVVKPLKSILLADQLRKHDIYITASRNDPCSNALIEALACGLPAMYFKSGGHPEIVGEAGLGFDSPEEIPELLERLIEKYEVYQRAIHINTMTDVARKYLQVMNIIL